MRAAGKLLSGEPKPKLLKPRPVISPVISDLSMHSAMSAGAPQRDGRLLRRRARPTGPLAAARPSRPSGPGWQLVVAMLRMMTSHEEHADRLTVASKQRGCLRRTYKLKTPKQFPTPCTYTLRAYKILLIFWAQLVHDWTRTYLRALRYAWAVAKRPSHPPTCTDTHTRA